MRYLFWVSVALLAYTSIGYPAWLYIASRWRRRVICRKHICPDISVVMAVHNEAASLTAKLENLLKLNYPADRLEFVVVSDGSEDGTNEILRAWEKDRQRILVLPFNQGKAAALNLAVASVRGEILVFTDARQLIEPDALRVLAENFADPSVGCVSGELMLNEGSGDPTKAGLGFYWGWEKKIRQWESASGSVVGVTGALYAARKCLVPELPAGTILDDVYIPLHAAGHGHRVIFDGRAISYDRLATSKREFWRKVRTLAGNYQLLQLAPWLLTSANPIRFRFLSHKVLRLLSPLALLGILIPSLFLPSAVYRTVLAGEIVLALCALLGALHPRMGVISRVAEACFGFVLLNAAALVAFAYVATGRKVVWRRPDVFGRSRDTTGLASEKATSGR